MIPTTYYLDDPEPARIRSSFAAALNPNRTGGTFPPAIDILYALRQSLSLSRPDDFLGCSFTDVIKNERVPSESKGALIRREIIPHGVEVMWIAVGVDGRQLATWR
jgi:hypothetical protein